ncbi:MAG: TnpV protein [Finegoldia sp.]|uniref:TnpV protein n=1 Tax=Finegoldia sp. TaxID=1981334 RepID=UPI003995EBE1
MTTQMNYSKVGEYLIPEIQLQNTEAKPLGKYARMRRAFLKENRPMTYNDMILTETLFPHLWEVDETANKRMEVLMNQLLEKNPAPSKKENQMSWVQHMNALKAQAEEVIMTELINN